MQNEERRSDDEATQRWRRRLAILLLPLLLIGCAGRQSADWSGPREQAVVESEQWSYQGRAGQKFRSGNYVIHTTVENPRVAQRLAQVMEGALVEYRRLVPDVPLTDRPMECYIFGTRAEWSHYTRRNAGPAASVYLNIRRGGYALGDKYVAFFIGEDRTYSLAAHEGFHQYVARHFAGRLPPFLEEGLACMFEHIRWQRELPTWNLSINPHRAHALRRALETRRTWPLEELITKHAGDIVSLPGDRIEAFYAQNWAFARFLWEGERGKYRPALQQLLSDTALGTVQNPTFSNRRAMLPWHPQSVRPLLEHYLGEDFATIESQYERWMRYIAFEEFSRHWQS